MAITLRQESATGATTKGSSLTFAELDNNFKHLLNLGTVQVTADSGTAQTLGESGVHSILTIAGAGGASTAIAAPDSAGETVVTVTSSGISNVVEDTTPQLGGALDVNGQNIVSVSNGNISIVPNGSGNISLTPTSGNITLGATNYPTADGSADQWITTAGNGTLSWTNNLYNATLKDYKETIYASGGTTGTITPNCSNGNVQTITLTGAITLNAFASPEAGQSMTLIVRQDSGGSGFTLTSSMLFAGGTKTLSTGANAYDVISIVYDGTTYYASLSTNFS
tara:strand:+ start:5462 stop:6304 length:843 start_codon:yes stop_codon:yes gene_type:complete